MRDLSIYNSLVGKKEKFVPVTEGNVGIYVCGPTVYSEVHLGNCRTFVSFDIVVRYLRFLGYKVRYVRNITDAGHLENDADFGEDKISKKAKIEQLEPMEIVQKYTLYFHNVMSKFNTLPPSIEPTATGHIVEQIEMVKSILENGHAYVENGSVYFDVNQFTLDGNVYGDLSRRAVDELMAGSRNLQGQEEKKNPADFALWKKASPEHIMKWPSPWGDGFPGWHLECSAMGAKYLGNQFDIHGGGMDLKFPHHECEIAQCVSAHKKNPVNYWMHSNMLTLNGKRMSKSTGNTLLPEDIFSGNNSILEKSFSPMVVRFFMLQAHYRSVLDFSSDALSASEKGYNKLMDAHSLLQNLSYTKTTFDEQLDFKVDKLINLCYSHMNDDFNTPLTIATLFELVSIVNTLNSSKTVGNLSEKTFKKLQNNFHGFVSDVLGLEGKSNEQRDDKSEKLVELVLAMRAEAKSNKDYTLSDKIRDDLSKIGVVIKDGKDGTTYTIT